MDPKMDSGCVKPGDEFEELFDVSRALDAQEVLGVMDQLLCHEMSWHLGYPLAQTILTSVYVEALLMPVPSSIEQAYFVRRGNLDANRHPMLLVLRAYCLGMLKVCSYVNERIKSEHFYEEEDFVTNTYHRTLLTNIPTSDVLLTLAEAKAVVASQRGLIDEELVDALTSRLELRWLFLEAVECPQYVKDANKARRLWEEAQAVLPSINATHALSKPVDEAFSAKLQRKLASTMPPRPIVELGFDAAFDHLSRLFADGLEVISVLDYVDSQCLLTFVLTFQAKKPQPLVYVRTLLQTFLFNAMEILGSMSIRQLLDDDFSIISMPASPLLDRGNDEIEVVQDPRFAMSQQMEFFRQRAAQPFLDILRTACQNRSRVRRTLCHTIREWESLQVEAEEIDQVLQVKTKETPLVHRPSMSAPPVESYALPLSSWTYLYKLRQMEWIVQLGFELEVYQPDELGGMYWYLNYLSKSRLQHSERIKGFIVHKTEEARSQPAPMADANADEQLQRSLAYTRLSLLDAAVTWELADALCCVYAVLGRLGLVKPPPRPYSNDELRYDLRMKPFVAVGFPALPNFHQFTAGVAQSESTLQELLEYAERAVAGAKRGFEALSKLSAKESFSVGSHDRWAASVKGALRSTIATGIAVSSVQKALSKQAAEGSHLGIKAEVPTPDKAYHEWWIVPKIVPVAP
ncbi:N-alpha-acetyltransferase, non-catalitic subunit, variant 2 [Purpureocillium takamizusanense]|nr:N-alpha-acetyltransferase, non-catalitic subunit, variant 2 [Purpureocillium takamizusanense]UNI20121.1 N-alpha-acetyltransferase, non-catalitic subunit, variant 2 [Purpureocillium takamizusanense]